MINLDDIQISYYNRVVAGFISNGTTLQRKSLKNYIDEVLAYTNVECKSGIEHLLAEDQYREDGVYDVNLLQDINRRTNNKFSRIFTNDKKFVQSYYSEYNSAKNQENLLLKTIKDKEPCIWTSLFKDNYYNGRDSVYDAGCLCIAIDFDNELIYTVVKNHFKDLCKNIPNIIWCKRSFSGKCHLFVYVDKVYLSTWMKNALDIEDDVYLSSGGNNHREIFKYCYTLYVHYIAEKLYELYGEDFFIDNRQVKLTDKEKDVHNSTASQQLGGAYCPDILVNDDIQEIDMEEVYNYVCDKIGQDTVKIGDCNLKQKNVYIRNFNAGNAPQRVFGDLIKIDRYTQIDGIKKTGNDLRVWIVYMLIKKYGADYARDVIVSNFEQKTASEMLATWNSNKNKKPEDFLPCTEVWKWIEIFKPVVNNSVKWTLNDEEYLSSKIDDIRKMLINNNVYLYSPCGSGKSTLARELCGFKPDKPKDMFSFDDNCGNKVIIACHLNSIMISVYRELSQYILRDDALASALITGRVPDIAIVSYNGLIRLLDTPETRACICKDYTIIVDEIHSVVSTLSYRSKVMIPLMYRLPEKNCIFLSGTPCGEEYILPNIIFVEVEKKMKQIINYNYIINQDTSKKKFDVTYTLINMGLEIQDRLEKSGLTYKIMIYDNYDHPVIGNTLQKIIGDKTLMISRAEKDKNDRRLKEWIASMENRGMADWAIKNQIENDKTEISKFYTENKSDSKVIITTSYSDEGIEVKDELDVAYVIMRASDCFKQLVFQRIYRLRNAKNIFVCILDDERKKEINNVEIINKTLSNIGEMVDNGTITKREYASLCENITLMCDSSEIKNDEMAMAAKLAASFYNLKQNYQINKSNYSTMLPGCTIKPYNYAVYGEIKRTVIEHDVYVKEVAVSKHVKKILADYNAIIDDARIWLEDGTYTTYKLIDFRTVYDINKKTYTIDKSVISDEDKLKLWIDSVSQNTGVAHSNDIKAVKDVLSIIYKLWMACRKVKYILHKNKNDIYTVHTLPLKNNIEWDVYDAETMKETVERNGPEYESECLKLAACIVKMFTYGGEVKWKSIKRFLNLREKLVLDSLTAGKYYGEDFDSKPEKILNIYERCNANIDDDFSKSLYQMKDQFFDWYDKKYELDKWGKVKIKKYKLIADDGCSGSLVFDSVKDAYDYLYSQGIVTSKFSTFKDRTFVKYIKKC